MRDYTAIWVLTDGADSGTGYDGNTTYDGDAGAQQLFETLVGASHLFFEPKTDWTEKDAMNAEDFNAIEVNTATAAWYLRHIQYAIPELATVTGRTRTFIDLLSSINRIEANLETIRANFVTPIGYPGTKEWGRGDGFDWRDANRLEMDAKMLFELGQLLIRNLRYCGTFYAGQAGGLG